MNIIVFGAAIIIFLFGLWWQQVEIERRAIAIRLMSNWLVGEARRPIPKSLYLRAWEWLFGGIH